MAKQDKLRFNAWTMGGRGAELFEKSPEDLELERMNPLRGVDEWRLGQIFDDARSGVYADLAWLYNEIEQVEPALCVCCDMRESAANEFGWIVRTAPEDRTRGFDASLADEQRRALLVEFGAVEDDLADLACHLDSAFFRGAAHAQPLWNADGSLAGFRALDLWNFALDRQTGVWYWNADASRDESAFQPVPPGEVVSLASSRHVDHSALPIFIRSALGAKRYGVWLDRFGIPPVGVIMPATAERADQAAYMDLARKFARGGSGILPNGSSIVYGTEARAVCPFPEFVRFQQQQIYTVALGRVQSGESAGDNLGGNAAGVVEGGFRRIVRRDARRIARAINDAVTRKILARLFPGRPALAQFAWDTEAKRTGSEVLEDAVRARNAGLEIDVGQIAEMTGYRVASAPETPSPGAFGGLNSRTGGATPLQRPLQGLAKREEGPGRTTEPAGGETPQRAILAAFAKDTSKAADEVRRLLDDPTPERAGKLLADLPSLIPDDPALAAVIADAMANGFAKTFTNETPADKPAPGSGERTRRTGAGEAAQSVNAEGVCTSPKGPAGCKSDTCPGKHGGEAVPQNDGKIDFRGNAKAKSKADAQSVALGYDGIDALVKKSADVPRATIDNILGGGDFTCEPHEAIAALRTLSTITSNIDGGTVKLSERAIRHYVCGERRHHGGEPDIGRLRSLPKAIDAVKHADRRNWVLDGRPVVVFPGEEPIKGTQAVYSKNRGRTKTFAYADSGVLNGWQVNE